MNKNDMKEMYYEWNKYRFIDTLISLIGFFLFLFACDIISWMFN